MSGSKSKSSKSSRAKNLDQHLALKHRINRLKDYIRRHINDKQAVESLNNLIKKLQSVK